MLFIKGKYSVTENYLQFAKYRNNCRNPEFSLFSVYDVKDLSTEIMVILPLKNL